MIWKILIGFLEFVYREISFLVALQLALVYQNLFTEKTYQIWLPIYSEKMVQALNFLPKYNLYILILSKVRQDQDIQIIPI